MKISARTGLRRALQRGAVQSKPRPANTLVQLQAPAAQSPRPTSRVQTVAHAVATDPACKGKADLALAMLADDELAGVTGAGLVKLLGRVDADRYRMGGIARRADPHDWGAIHDGIRARRDTQIEGI